jgi:hypothetical protein
VNPPKPRRPVCPAIVFCQKATAYPDVRQFDLLRVFSGLGVPAVPVVLTMIVVFTITDGEGDYRLDLSIEHDESEQILVMMDSSVSLRSPVVVHDQAVPITFKVEQFGTYTVKLKANGDMIGQRTFSVLPDGPPA